MTATHNLKVVGSNPTPATNLTKSLQTHHNCSPRGAFAVSNANLKINNDGKIQHIIHLHDAPDESEISNCDQAHESSRSRMKRAALKTEKDSRSLKVRELTTQHQIDFPNGVLP